MIFSQALNLTQNLYTELKINLLLLIKNIVDMSTYVRPKRNKKKIEDFVGQNCDQQGFVKRKINDEIGGYFSLNKLYAKTF